MNKVSISVILMLCVTAARATDVATSQAYVDTAAAGLQDKLPAKTSDKVATYTNVAGTTGEREIKTELGNESTNQADTGLTTVGTVKAAVDGKQVKLSARPDTNIVTYSGTTTISISGSTIFGPGLLTTTPIYDDTINTFDNGLVTAKTLNDAVIAGVNAEVTRINTPKGTLWRFNRSAPKVLPTTANLPANIDGMDYCYRRVQKGEKTAENHNGNCSTTMFNDKMPYRGDWGVRFPYRTGIRYDNDTCVGHYCYQEIHGISACVADSFTGIGLYVAVPSTNTTLIGKLEAAYEAGKTGATPSGSRCYCKMTEPVLASSPWIYRNNYSPAESCAVSCAEECGWAIADRLNARTTLFGAASVPATPATE